ncbi:LysR family transcriptional regulator [Rhodospirillaceae bacterium KN72]|uniref:LysR family transcriptional regulator n=1 Tax=Pacificispira spongiicola TaxID=2729598 RepID=A0A7Y0E0I7_9PROT|nr:LysR family transcriptional regulator [Pacificispira spongiicola]NMM44995.1 LysR family transcriptional regulator [Pacificispira spongiicola]
MDRIDRMALFTRIVESGSFARAASDLGVARSTATEAVKVLERETGTRLLARTTRQVRPTAEGDIFYHHARAILTAVDDAYGASRQGAPSGHLRIGASGLLTRTFLVPRLPDFLTRYPDITVEFGQTDRFVDLVRDGVDCVIRAGEPDDSGLMMRRLGALPEITCASPAYLAAHGTPTDIDDLDGHHMVGFLSSRTGKVLPLEFQRDGSVETRVVPARVTTDNSDTASALALSDFGLIQAPRYRFEAQLADGRMIEVLAETPPEPIPLNVLYAGSRHMSRRLDVLLDWIAEIFADAL